MTAYDTGVALACQLTESLTTPVLEGLTPLERLDLAARPADEKHQRWFDVHADDRDRLRTFQTFRELTRLAVVLDPADQVALAEALATYAGHLGAAADPREEHAISLEEARRVEADQWGFQ